MNTKAAVLFELNKPLHLINMGIPDLKPGQVLVKVVYSGVCHTQLNEIRGLKGEDKFLPHTLGHEGSGVVLQTGSEVKKVSPGDHVVLSWIKGIGKDIPFCIYDSDYGSVNSGAVSTFLTKAVVSENRLIPIPKTMPLKEAALLGCAIPTGAGIVRNTLKLMQGDSIAILGAGGIGLSAIIAAKALGASTIIAVDIVDKKLTLAQELGATHIVNGSKNDPESEIYKITGGKLVDYAIEAAGTVATMETAFKVINYGGQCIIAGNIPQGEKITIDPMDLIKGKQIRGTWGGNTLPDDDIPTYSDLYQSGEMKLSQLITHEYRLADINQAFYDLGNGQVGRAILALEEEN